MTDYMEMQKKLIIFSPHPDDETIGCGGTLAKKVSKGYDVIIVVLTDGRHALSKTYGIYSDPTPEELKVIRKREIKRALKILGVPEKNIFFLDYEDGELEKFEKEAENEILRIISKINPNEIYVPYKNEYHSDHRSTNRIVKNVLRTLNTNIPVYQYTVLQKNPIIRPIIDSIINVVKRNMIKVDITDYFELKVLALKEFKSQIKINSASYKKGIFDVNLFKKHLSKKEIFYLDDKLL